MLIANNKPLCFIGYNNSSITHEIKFMVSKEFVGDTLTISPKEFFKLNNKQQYQYIVAFTLDTIERIQVINLIEELKLDCITYIHDTTVLYTDDPTSVIGHGTWIAPHNAILLDSKIGKHCIIEINCLVAHYSELGDNVQLHPGVLIAGKTYIGKNSVFNFKSGVINGLTICDNIELGATSTITKSIEKSGFYLGSPARRVSDRKTFNEDKNV